MTLRTLMEPATAGDSADIRGAVSIRAIEEHELAGEGRPGPSRGAGSIISR